MKRVLQVVALVVALGTTAVAQESGVGIKGGLNISAVGGDNSDDNEARISFHAGAFYRYMATDKIAIQPELIYSQEGATNGDFTLALNYLNIPVVGKYYFTESLNLQAGVQLGLLMSANVKDDNNDVDVKEFYTGTNFSIPLGIGYDLENGLGFDLRYNIGLSNISDVDGFKSNTGALQISVGYKF